MCDAYLSLAGIFILGTLSIMTVDKYLHTKCFFPFLILREGFTLNNKHLLLHYIAVLHCNKDKHVHRYHKGRRVKT